MNLNPDCSITEKGKLRGDRRRRRKKRGRRRTFSIVRLKNPPAKSRIPAQLTSIKTIAYMETIILFI